MSDSPCAARIRSACTSLGRVSLALVVMATITLAQITYHVDDGALPSGNGLSWATAFQTLDQALAAVQNGDSIWVAEGVYKPRVRTVANDPRSVTFNMPGDIAVYGGFAGNETSLASRAGLFDTTVLSGELGVQGAADNAYHVVTFRNRPFGLRIDGFKIRAGNAVGAVASAEQGGGIYMENAVQLYLANCIISDNAATQGGGIGGSPAAYLVVACDIFRNTATGDGGGISIRTSSLRMWNSRVMGNTAGTRGGGIFIQNTGSLNANSAVQGNDFMNCVFYGNVAGTRGGAVHMTPGSVNGMIIINPGSGRFTNCTFSANSAGTAGGSIHAINNTPLASQCWIRNSISWGNSAPMDPEIIGDIDVLSSDILGGWPGTGNINADPLFVNPAAANLRIASGSPAKNAGDNSLIVIDLFDLNQNGVFNEPTPYDLDFLRRIEQQTVDMGAYEVH